MIRVVMLLGVMSLGLFAQTSEVETPDSVRTRLCDSWRYSSDFSGYTCSFLGSYVNLVEARDHQMTMEKVVARISELEKQVEQLKAQCSP